MGNFTLVYQNLPEPYATGLRFVDLKHQYLSKSYMKEKIVRPYRNRTV